jgi:PAS domain-containing protein
MPAATSKPSFNPAARALFGYSEHEAIGRPFTMEIEYGEIMLGDWLAESPFAIADRDSDPLGRSARAALDR